VPERALPLSALEQATGLIAGPHPDLPALPDAGSRPARAVFEDIISEGLRRPPCVVSFSGGRDSSAVLATAVSVARREGLPLPVPVTLRFPAVASTEETEWQELVVAHLGLTDWERIVVTSEVDWLGELACTALARHGLLWPPNAHFHVPMFRTAPGGTLLTGLDGDGLLGAWRWKRPQSVLARRTSPRPRDVLRVGLALAPAPVRRAAMRRQGLPPVSWLRPTAQRAFARHWVEASAAEPRRWDDRMAWYGKRRYLHLARHSLALLAADEGCEVRHPLSDPRFVAALARDGGTSGWGDRTETMAALFGDLLPRALIERRRKAEFGRAFWQREARRFAETWDGSGVDDSMVDGDRLRQAWAAENPVFASITPLLLAWLARSGEVSQTSPGAVDRPPAGLPARSGE
jgi:hypothetical protein